MPIQIERRTVPYAVDQMMQLVSDVKAYPDFLPGVMAARVTPLSTEGSFDATLWVGSGPFQQEYTSYVVVDAVNKIIHATNRDGPFHHLKTRWTFSPTGHQQKPQTTIEFYMDFEINKPLLRPILQPLLTQMTSAMIDAFEKRAHEVF